MFNRAFYGFMVSVSLLQVFLTKHYRNRRAGDPEFALDFEEIYVIDSKTKSITRAKVVVRNRDKFDLMPFLLDLLIYVDQVFFLIKRSSFISWT